MPVGTPPKGAICSQVAEIAAATSPSKANGPTQTRTRGQSIFPGEQRQGMAVPEVLSIHERTDCWPGSRVPPDTAISGRASPVDLGYRLLSLYATPARAESCVVMSVVHPLVLVLVSPHRTTNASSALAIFGASLASVAIVKP